MSVKLISTQVDASDITSGTLADARISESSVTQHADAVIAAADMTAYEETASKGQADGYASLDGTGKIPVAQIPAIAITEYLGTAADQPAMLALSGQKGDWCIRTDSDTVYVITGDDPTQAADWTELEYPAGGGSVTSVAGRTGDVVLAASDIESGTLADARVAESNVTQHQAALSITESQISDFGDYLPLTGGTITGAVQLDSTPTISNGNISHYRHGTSAGGDAPLYQMFRSRGSFATPSAVLDGDRCFALIGRGYNSTAAAYRIMGGIEFWVDGSPASGTPGRLDVTLYKSDNTTTKSLCIHNDGSISLLEGGSEPSSYSGRMKIFESSGTVKAKTSGGTVIDLGGAGGSAVFPVPSASLVTSSTTMTVGEVARVDLNTAAADVTLTFPSSPSIGDVVGALIDTAGSDITTSGFTLTASGSNDTTLTGAVVQTAYTTYNAIGAKDGVQSQSVNVNIQNDNEFTSWTYTVEVGVSQSAGTILEATKATFSGTLSGDSNTNLSINLGDMLDTLVKDASYNPANPIYISCRKTADNRSDPTWAAQWNGVNATHASVSMTQESVTPYELLFNRNGELIDGGTATETLTAAKTLRVWQYFGGAEGWKTIIPYSDPA